MRLKDYMVLLANELQKTDYGMSVKLNITQEEDGIHVSNRDRGNTVEFNLFRCKKNKALGHVIHPFRKSKERKKKPRR